MITKTAIAEFAVRHVLLPLVKNLSLRHRMRLAESIRQDIAAEESRRIAATRAATLLLVVIFGAGCTSSPLWMRKAYILGHDALFGAPSQDEKHQFERVAE